MSHKDINVRNLTKINALLKSLVQNKCTNSILFYKSSLDIHNIAKYCAISSSEWYYSSKFKPGFFTKKTKYQKPKLIFINGCFHSQDWWFINEAFKLSVPIISFIANNANKKKGVMELKWDNVITLPLYTEAENIRNIYAYSILISNMIKQHKLDLNQR